MSETLRDLVVSLSLNSDNFTRNIKSINKQIQEAESAFRLASAGVENFETTTAGLSSKLSTLQRTFQLQQDAVGQYERALQQASDKLQECYTRQNDYAQRLADAKDKQLQLKTEVASAAQAYKHYKNTLGETDSATVLGSWIINREPGVISSRSAAIATTVAAEAAVPEMVIITFPG